MLTISMLIMFPSFLMSLSQWVSSAHGAFVKAEPESFLCSLSARSTLLVLDLLNEF